jgi:hypothetical protein
MAIAVLFNKLELCELTLSFFSHSVLYVLTIINILIVVGVTVVGSRVAGSGPGTVVQGP